MAVRPKSRTGKLGAVCLAALMLTVGYIMGHSEQSEEHKIGLVGEAEAAGGKIGGPNEIAPNRYVEDRDLGDIGRRLGPRQVHPVGARRRDGRGRQKQQRRDKEMRMRKAVRTLVASRSDHCSGLYQGFFVRQS